MNWDLLFDAPWWLPLGLLLAGGAVWVSGNRRRDKALLNVGWAIIAAAVAVGAIAWLVETPRERAERDTRALVDAVVAQRLDTVRQILDPRAHVNVLGGRTQYGDREQIVAAVDRADELYGLKSARITRLQSQRQGPLITVNLDVTSVQDATMGRPLPTSWQLEFQRGEEGWKLWRITLVRLHTLSSEDAQRHFPVLRRGE